eukprot:6178406-Pleurochrysis_carterae.AAC.1
MVDHRPWQLRSFACLHRGRRSGLSARALPSALGAHAHLLRRTNSDVGTSWAHGCERVCVSALARASSSLRIERVHARACKRARSQVPMHARVFTNSLRSATSHMCRPCQKCYLAEKLAYICVDEAHCCAVQGHDFRPDYLALGTALTCMRPRVSVSLKLAPNRFQR